MKKIVRVVCAALIASMFFASCGSTSNVEGEKTTKQKKSKKVKYDETLFKAAYSKGDYDACLAMLEARGSNPILTGLDSSMIQFVKKDYMPSALELLQAQKNMQAVKAEMTAGKAMAAALTKESAVTYTGAVYERILTYSMMAVDALKMGEIDRAVGVVKNYTENYKDEITPLIEEQKKLEKESEEGINGENVGKAKAALAALGLDVDSALAKAPKAEGTVQSYENSAFLSYLTTVISAANNDPEHAKIASLMLKDANPNVDVSEDIEVPAGKGRLDVVALSDLIGKRSSGSTEQFALGSLMGVTVSFKFAYPEFNENLQNHSIKVNKVTLSNGESKEFTLIEDFDEAVKMDVASKYKGALSRSVIRNIVKNSTAAVAGVASIKAAEAAANKASSNPIAAKAAQTALAAAKQGVNVALLAVVDAEAADVRQCSYFPNKASAAGFTVDPGKYDVTVEYSNGRQDVIKDVVVEAGKPTVVVSECMSPASGIASSANAK